MAAQTPIPFRRIISPAGELRIELCSAFRAGAVKLPELEPRRLRYALGSSIADLKIPYEITADAVRIVTFGAVQLAVMLVARHKDVLPRGEFDRFLMDERFGALPSIPETLTGQSTHPDIRTAAELAPRAHPALTGGVMAAWLGPGGGGRSLVALVIEKLRTAIGEMAACNGREETPTLIALMLGSLLPKVEAALAAVPLSHPTDRMIRGAAACGVYLALRLGLERALRDTRLPAAVAMRMEAPINPTVLLGGRGGVVQSGATLFGGELTVGIPFFEEMSSRMAAGASADAIQAHLAQLLAADREVSRKVEATAALSLLRERFIGAATLGDQGFLPRDLATLFRDLVMYPAKLQALLDDEKARKRLCKELPGRVQNARPRVTGALQTVVEALTGFNPKSPSAALGMSREEALRVYARSAIALLCDLWLDRALLPARRALDPRTGTEAEGGNAAEYEAGRLYRISTQSAPLLRDRVVAQVGHLFADVKDFTRRTSLVGQAAIGDLLRREFYAPVIAAAKRHYAGFSVLPDKGGIQLNNLLGDAISLSGTITGLVALATELRRHLQSYERRLAREISRDEVARAVQAIEAEYTAKLLTAPPQLQPKIAAEKEQALARARGEGLEAGVFISYGPAPIVITISDELFGQSRVAIAEKINESARGTARSAGARALADAELAAERARLGDPNLQHPFSVFVGAPLPLNVAPAIEQQVRSALARGDVAGARRTLENAITQALEQAARPDPDSPGDIYNNGIALSEEALLGFQQEIGPERVFRGVEVHPASLHEAIRRRFFFPDRPLRLIAAFSPEGALKELFRYAGRVMFKGFERQGGIRIWELVSETLAGQLIQQYHAAAWFRVPAPKGASAGTG
ncbi:MAG: hypothetical protein IRZ16_04895 [Myxococcaceae bacterium]|nr:hypothetical protein [Myxococcaceae bacterium]